MKILITGSGGMLGRELRGVLSKGENEIAGLDIALTDMAKPEPGVFYNVNINDAEEIKKVFEKEKPDIVIHTAAWTDVDGSEKDPEKARKINVEGTVNVAESARKHSADLLYISTDFVFDGGKNAPYTELDECAPLSVYAKTKWEGENKVRGSLENYAIVRTSWLFGPGGKNFVKAIVSRSKDHKTIQVVNDQTGSPTYTKDLADSVKKLLEKGIKGGEIYHVCNSGQCSWYEFALKIKDLVPEMKDVNIVPLSSVELGRSAPRPAYSVMNTSKFREHTGMSLRNWQEALEEYLCEEGRAKR
ncbi:MAG: dTDP-4-dehydrorhamnose reductase [Candidatus Omnitrophota bacterium]